MEGENSQDENKKVMVGIEKDNEFNDVQCPHSGVLDKAMGSYN